MALKRPLVINSGQIEQLQSGDYINVGEIPQLTNGNAGAVVIGSAVYASAADTYDKARADAVGTVNVIGLASDISTAAAGVGGVQMDGILTATTAQWDAIAGTTGGLTFNSYYYLSPTTAGALTATAPSTTGQFIMCVGIAISTTEIKISIKPRIKL